MSDKKDPSMESFLEPTGLSYSERCVNGLEIFKWNSEKEQSWSKTICPNSVCLPDHPLIKDSTTEHVFVLTPTKDMGNYYGAIHGGCVGTLVDVFTSIAIMAFEDPPGLAVSVTMNIDYFKSIKITSKIYIKTKINKFGRRLAFSSCEIFDEKMNLCYTANHTKMRMNLSLMKDKL